MAPSRIVQCNVQLEDVPLPSRRRELLQPAREQFGKRVFSPEPRTRIRCGHSLAPLRGLDDALDRVDNQPTDSIIASMARRSGTGRVGHAAMIAESSGDGPFRLSVHLLAHPGGKDVAKSCDSWGLVGCCGGLSLRRLRVRPPPPSYQKRPAILWVAGLFRFATSLL